MRHGQAELLHRSHMRLWSLWSVEDVAIFHIAKYEGGCCLDISWVVIYTTKNAGYSHVFLAVFTKKRDYS